MSAKDILGLWCDDITFCQEDCEDMECPRNKHNIRDKRFPHSYFVERPPDCPYRKDKKPVKPRVSTVEQRCGNCNKIIEMDGWICCPWCGREIDWSGWH